MKALNSRRSPRGNLIPGIEASEDRLLQGRLFSYFDTQRHRIGPNFQQLPVNRPATAAANYNQGGALSMRGTKGDINYQPSAQDTVAYVDTPSQKYSTLPLNGATMQRAIAKQNNFAQAGDLYLSFSPQERDHLIANMADDLRQVKSRAIQAKIIGFFYRANVEYGTRLAQALGVSLPEVKVTIAD